MVFPVQANMNRNGGLPNEPCTLFFEKFHQKSTPPSPPYHVLLFRESNFCLIKFMSKHRCTVSKTVDEKVDESSLLHLTCVAVKQIPSRCARPPTWSCPCPWQHAWQRLWACQVRDASSVLAPLVDHVDSRLNTNLHDVFSIFSDQKTNGAVCCECMKLLK